MTSESFCYWLQGFLEIGQPKSLTAKQLDQIKNHLSMVFFHEIDPKLNKTEEHKDKLNQLHNPGKHPFSPSSTLIRC